MAFLKIEQTMHNQRTDVRGPIHLTVDLYRGQLVMMLSKEPGYLILLV